MSILYFSFFLALVAGCVNARPESISAIAGIRRQTDPSTMDCNTICTNYQELNASCNTPHCGCSISFIKAQGECLVCQTSSPKDAAAVQFLLDTEMTQCQIEGINVEFQLDLPPPAAAIVHKFDRDSASLRHSQTAFLALQIAGGHIGLVIVLALGVFSRKHRRDPTFLNFCITWIFSSIMFSLLLYRGTKGNTVVNSLGKVIPTKCVAQAALTEGAQVMTACSTLALVIQLWLNLRVTTHGHPSSHGKHQVWWMTCVFVITPYILFIAFAVPSAFVGSGKEVFQGLLFEKAIPSNFYCAVISLDPFLQAVYAVMLGLLLITMVFDALILKHLYRHWRAFRHVKTDNAVSLPSLLRVMTFSLFRVVVAAAYAIVVAISPSVDSSGQHDSLAVISGIPIWVDLLQAATPLVAFLILGINADTINYLTFWRRIDETSKVLPTTIKRISISNSDENEDEDDWVKKDRNFVSASL